MTRRCFVILSTDHGLGYAEVVVNSLQQLALLMPAQVVRYVVEDKGETIQAPVTDDELHDLLTGVVRDIAREPAGWLS